LSPAANRWASVSDACFRATVVFLANMELGYLMPPMGENLFLSSYRFNRPLTWVYRSTLPYTAIIFGAVLLITYVPGLTLWLVAAFEQLGYLR
jgi:TRAP-type C4-dicarboxylate transport system permease large subunit